MKQKIVILKEIIFDRNYEKLHNQDLAVLIQTSILRGKDIKDEFVKYDTDYKFKIDRNQTYLYLVFVGNKMIPFTTLRKINTENIEKYIGAEGDYFEVVIKEEEKPLPNHWVPM